MPIRIMIFKLLHFLIYYFAVQHNTKSIQFFNCFEKSGKICRNCLNVFINKNIHLLTENVKILKVSALEGFQVTIFTMDNLKMWNFSSVQQQNSSVGIVLDVDCELGVQILDTVRIFSTLENSNLKVNII